MAGLSSKKFKVFDFSEEDERVEKVSEKVLGKFGIFRKKYRQSSPQDKYKFLQCFAQGTKLQQKENSCEPIDDDAGGDKTHQKEIMEKLLDADICGMGNHCANSLSDPKGMRREGGTFRETSGLNTSLLSSSLKYESEQITVSSDDDDCIEMNSSASSSPLLDNEVSLEEWVAERGSCGHVIDVVNKTVVVFPDFIIYGDMYCTESRITFSCSSIKVEGSSVNGTKGTLRSNWTTGDIIKIHSEWQGRVETAIINLTLKSKNSIGSGNANEISGIELLKFAVYDPHWSKAQEVIQLLDVRYKDTWNATIDYDREDEVDIFSCRKSKLLSKQYLFESNEPFKDVIYPKGDPDAVLISKRDVELLQPETFINDTIIDFYIKYLKNKIQPEQQNRFHFFNSFFFRKLADLDKDPSTACEVKAAFQRVRKWTKNVNLFEKDYVFIPVNYSLHWSLIVICHPGEVAYFKDDEIEKSPKVPCILHMDSIKGSHRGLKSLVQSYLFEEWKERHSKTEDDVPLKFLKLRFVTLELPQQENSSDCGLFLLHYVELFLEEAPLNFNPFKITGYSNFLNRNWFPPAEASLKRTHIKKLIYEICEDHSNKDPSTDCIDEYSSFQLSLDKDGQKTGVVTLGQISSPTKICRQGYSSISGVEKGIEIWVSGGLPQRVEQGLADSGFMFREHCQQISACHERSIMSPIKEVEETSEQMANSRSAVEHHQKVAGPATECSTSYSCNDSRVLQKMSSDQQFSLHFEEQDESISEYQISSKEAIAEDQPLADFEGPNHLETTDKPEASSISRGEFAAFVVEDSQEEYEELAALVVEDSQEENELAPLVEDSQEVNCTQDGCENKNSGSSFKEDTCTPSHQGVHWTENNYLRENKMPIIDEDSVSEANEQQVTKKLRLMIHGDGKQVARSTPKGLLS